MNPTINVNLKPCSYYGVCNVHQSGHIAECSATPILISCPIPRSVTLEVVPGECTCFHRGPKNAAPPPTWVHSVTCPARPVKVSCSISGKTWEESHLSAWETEDGIGLNTTVEAGEADARWVLVKALVLGRQAEPAETEPVASMSAKRAAVFAALADMARAEEAAFEAQERVIRAMGEPAFLPDSFHRAEPHARASASLLGRYVERIIEQVGVLP